MSGIKTTALYGIYPFELNLCGPLGEKPKKILSGYLSGEDVSEKDVRKVLEGFEGAYPYYKRIAESNGIDDPFDEKVVRAYWTGNELLDKTENAHHSYHVYVVGSVTGRIELKGKLLDICRVSWGKVLKIEDNKVIVKYQPIKDNVLVDFVEKSFLWRKEYVPKIEIGDIVSCHWNYVVEVISQQDVKNLKKYTNLTLNSIIDK